MNEDVTPMLSDKAYNFVKWVVMVLLPAISAAYFALSQLLGLPAGEEVVGVLAILATFLSVVLGLSNKSYVKSGAQFDGVINLEEDPGGIKKINLDVPGDPETLVMSKDVITFRVNR